MLGDGDGWGEAAAEAAGAQGAGEAGGQQWGGEGR